MFWIGFGAGMVVGAALGVIIIVCCIAANRSDEDGNN